MLKSKIINDPIHGFITIPQGIIQSIIDHPYFQRLRRIKQLGLTDYVYPGAVHTRFHHAIGAMHLMGVALESLRSKGHSISEEEEEAGCIAVLCHDLGHGPFSHALEHSFAQHIDHEAITLMLMHRLNQEFGNKLTLAIQMFEGVYPRPFFHQLVSSQLDVDRLDYLKRDSFFTGVIEGGVGSSRILKMIDLVNESIVVEEKAIYSVEHFLSARRLMYWQVYLHKTALSVEQMIVQIIRRASFASQLGMEVFAPPYLRIFLERNVGKLEFETNPDLLDAYLLLDDYDIWTCIKQWMLHPDKVLSDLCRALLNRKPFKVMLDNEPIDQVIKDKIGFDIQLHLGINTEELGYYMFEGIISNKAYVRGDNNINILKKNGEVLDIAQASDLPNIMAMSKIVSKYYLCYHKPISLRD